MSNFAPILGAVTRHRGIIACLVVAEEDGIVVDGSALVGVDTAAFAALTASLYRKAARAAVSAGFGGTTFCDLEAEQGRVLAAGRNGLVLVAVAESRANLGLLRVELLKAAAIL